MSFFDRLRRLLGEAPGGEGASECKPISCMEAMARVHEFLDGELEEISHEEVAQHFAVCQKCYPHLRLEERFREALKRSQKEEACPEHVRSKVLELLATETHE